MAFQIKCKSCKKAFDIKKDDTAPKGATGMGCNWCPACEDSAQEDYHEWYTYAPRKKKPSSTRPKPGQTELFK